MSHTVTTIDELNIVKLLAACKPRSYIETANKHLTVAQINEIAGRYGNRVQELRFAAARLQKQLDAEREIPTSTTRAGPRPATAPSPRAVPDRPPPRPAPVAPRTYVAVLRADQLFIDPAYQRAHDKRRCAAMAKAYDETLVGIIEVSARPDGRYAIVDGQHRWGMLRIVHSDRDRAPIACNVHTGLTPAQEANLFHQIDRTRRRLSGWDRWRARRHAGEQAVLDIEQTAHRYGLTIDSWPSDGNLRCVATCEKVVALGGLQLLDSTLQSVTASYGLAVDGLAGDIIEATALVLAYYPSHSLDLARLLAAMQSIAPRQVVARAKALQDVYSASTGRCAAQVLVDRYNNEPGRNLQSFLDVTAATRRGDRRDQSARLKRRHDNLMAELGGTTLADVKQWAQEKGIEIRRRRVPDGLIRRYLDEHDRGEPS